MGMDVYGTQPTSEQGEYFRNTVWYWHPLWEYCLNIAPDIAGKVESGHYNDGDGLGADDAVALARVLTQSLESGQTAEYERIYNEQRAATPRIECDLCDGTGIRTDAVGRDAGMPEKELDDASAIALGRAFGWCNACNGEGMKDSFDTYYYFTVDNVREFAQFCAASGGFSIC
jgi:hypothetical protein